MDQRRMRWVENGMDCQAESVVSRGRKSNCSLLTGGVLQVSIVGPVLFAVSDLVSPGRWKGFPPW